MDFKLAYLAFGHVDVTLPLVSEFESNGVDYELIFCFSQNKKKESVIDFSDIDVLNGYLEKEKNVHLISKELFSYYPFLKQCNFFIFNSLKLKSITNIVLAMRLFWNLRNVDVIHVSGDDAMVPVILLIAKLAGKKLVLTMHDFFPHSGENFSRHHNVLRKLNFRLANSVIFQNRADCGKAVKLHPVLKNKGHYIPFGMLDLYRCFNKKSQCATDFIFFGRISEYKGLSVLYEAYTLVEKKYPAVSLVIAGSGQDRSLHKWKTKKNVTLINRYITNKELASLIRGAKAVVCPYQDVSQSGVLMTALAFSKPVIASQIGSFEEIVSETGCGILVPPSDPASLAEAMIKTMEDQESVQKIKNNIDKMAELSSYSWPRIGRKMRTLYKKILQVSIIPL